MPAPQDSFLQKLKNDFTAVNAKDVRTLRNESKIFVDNEQYDTVDTINRSKSIETHSFPPELDQLGHWVSIRIAKFKYRRDSETSNDETIAYIILPLPQSLQTSYAQSWNSSELPMGLGSALEDFQGKGGASFGDALDSIKKTQGANIGANAFRPEVLGAAGGLAGSIAGHFIGGKAAGTAAGTGAGLIAAKALKAAKNVSINTFESVAYDKPVLRTHPFKWTLVARSAEESRYIRNIIRMMKYHSSPSSEQGGLLSYPETFDIDFSYQKNLFNIGPSIMESLSINYHREGRPIYAVESGTSKAPVHIEIDCTFKEIAAVTKESISKYNR
jgi:hypothetical protein